MSWKSILYLSLSLRVFWPFLNAFSIFASSAAVISTVSLVLRCTVQSVLTFVAFPRTILLILESEILLERLVSAHYAYEQYEPSNTTTWRIGGCVGLRQRKNPELRFPPFGMHRASAPPYAGRSLKRRLMNANALPLSPLTLPLSVGERQGNCSLYNAATVLLGGRPVRRLALRLWRRRGRRGGGGGGCRGGGRRGLRGRYRRRRRRWRWCGLGRRLPKV